MENWRRFRCRKFFRGLIASRQPEEIAKLLVKYEKDLKTTEGSYLDIVIRSEGAFSYRDIMEMPVNSIQMLIERMNNRVDEQNKANKAAMSKR